MSASFSDLNILKFIMSGIKLTKEINFIECKVLKITKDLKKLHNNLNYKLQNIFLKMLSSNGDVCSSHAQSSIVEATKTLVLISSQPPSECNLLGCPMHYC
jgi:hypothetical protein